MGMIGQVLGDAINLAGGTTFYAALQNTRIALGWTTEGRTKQPMPVAGTFDYLRVQVLTAPGGADTRQFTIRKTTGAGTGAAAGTALTTTITGAAISNQDITHNFSVSAGDCVDMEHISSATAATTNNITWAVRFTANNSNEYPLLWSNNAPTAAGATEYSPLQGTVVSQATEAIAECIIPTAGTLSNLYVDLDATAATSTFVFTLRVNGADSNDGSGNALSASVASGASTANDTTHTISVNAGDRICMKLINNGSATKRARFGVKFSPTTDGQSIILGSAGQSQAQSNTRFNDGNTGNSWTTVENQRQFCVIACTLKNLYGRVTGPLSNAQTVIGSLNKATVATGLTMTFTGDGVNPIAGNDTIHTASLADDDLLSLKAVTSATSGTVTANISFVLFISQSTNWTQTVNNTTALSNSVVKVFKWSRAEASVFSNLLVKNIRWNRSESTSISEALNKVAKFNIILFNSTSMLERLSNGQLNIYNSFAIAQTLTIIFKTGSIWSLTSSPAGSWTSGIATSTLWALTSSPVDSWTSGTATSTLWTLQPNTSTTWS